MASSRNINVTIRASERPKADHEIRLRIHPDNLRALVVYPGELPLKDEQGCRVRLCDMGDGTYQLFTSKDAAEGLIRVDG